MGNSVESAEDLKHIRVDLSKEKHTKFKIKCAEKDKSIKEVVIDAVDSFIEEG